MDRRRILATSSSGGPLSWFYADAAYVTVTAGKVVVWNDRLGSGSFIRQPNSALEPTWEASGGWDVTHSSVSFPGSAHELVTTGSRLGGLVGAFSLLSTLQTTDTVNNTTLAAWYNAGGTQWVAIKTVATAGNAFLRVERNNGVTLTGATGSIVLGGGHRRIGVSFDGSRVTTYVDTVRDINAQSLGSAVPATDRFALGWSGIDFSPQCRLTEALIYSSAVSAGVVTAYQASSLTNWGA